MDSHRQQGPQASYRQGQVSYRQGSMASHRLGMVSHRGDVSHRLQRQSFAVANDEAFVEHVISRMAAKITSREVWLQQVRCTHP
jgi:hypothetical protein